MASVVQVGMVGVTIHLVVDIMSQACSFARGSSGILFALFHHTAAGLG